MKRFVVLLALYLFVVQFCFAAPAANKKPTINTSKWTGVSLPFRPFDVTAAGDSFWVCGSNEMIAVSHDRGATWSMKHQQEGGEILLNISFLNENVGHATGTGGLLLSTSDGGQTWVAHRATGNIQEVFFADAMNGVAKIEDRVWLTSNQGESWHELAAMQADPKVRPFSQIESVAALDSMHYAVALHQPDGENIFLSTNDGGKVWTPTHLDNTFASQLTVHQGEYWAFGIEYVDRSNRGGYSVPVALHSTDGINWQHGVRASNEFDGCTVQGCYLRYGVLEVLYGNTEKIWSTPQDSPLAAKWAMLGDRICTIGQRLMCGSLVASDAPQPMPETNGPISISIERGTYTEGCLDCHLHPIPPKDARPGQQMMATVSFSIHRDGSVGDIQVQGTPSGIGNELKQQIAGWIITPVHEQGQTVASKRTMQLVVLCYPAFPNHPETGSCIAMAAAELQKAISRH